MAFRFRRIKTRHGFIPVPEECKKESNLTEIRGKMQHLTSNQSGRYRERRRAFGGRAGVFARLFKEFLEITHVDIQPFVLVSV